LVFGLVVWGWWGGGGVVVGIGWGGVGGGERGHFVYGTCNMLALHTDRDELAGHMYAYSDMLSSQRLQMHDKT